VRLPAEGRDQRRDQVLDLRLHDVAERHPDHDRDREVDEVASHEELPEAGHSPTISCAVRGGRKMPPTRRDQDVTIPAPGRRRWRCGQPAGPPRPGPAIPQVLPSRPVGAEMTFLEHSFVLPETSEYFA